MYFEIDIPSYEMEDLKVILGDGMVYQTDIQLHSGAFPKDVRVTSHPDYEVIEQPVPRIPMIETKANIPCRFSTSRRSRLQMSFRERT